MPLVNNYNKAIFNNGKYEMSLDEFKKWLKRFDVDEDGKISAVELREAIRAMGGWFSTIKSKNGIKSADKNHNGYVDEQEIKELKDFALKYLGVRIITY